MVDIPGTAAWPRRQEARFAILAAATIVAILLVCLYPFRFSLRHGDLNAIGALIRSWAKPPQTLDFVLNVPLYAPLGAFGALSLSPRSRPSWRWITVVTTAGALLSIAIELTQYFDATRYTSATDVYANTLGTFLGAAAVALLLRR